MAEYRLHCKAGLLDNSFVRRAFFAGWGRVPYRNHSTQYANDLLVVTIPENVSGTINVLRTHPQLGVLLEATDTLMPRERPYNFLKELCRGALGRIQRRCFEWQMTGFRPSADLQARIKKGTQAFSAIVSMDETSVELDKSASSMLTSIGDLQLALSQEYTTAMIEMRRRTSEHLPLLMAAGMGNHTAPESFFEFSIYAEELRNAFHAVMPMPTWRELEIEPGVWDWERLDRRVAMAYRYGFQVVGGPIIDFTASSLPKGVLASMRQEGVLEARAEKFVTSLVEHFDYAVSHWILARAINVTDISGLSTHRMVSLVRRLAEVVRARSPKKTIMVGVDQPWGDGNITSSLEQNQNHLVEALFAMNQVDAVLLETHLGLHMGSSFPRDTMSFSAMIDLWWHCGKSIYVSFSVPSDTTNVEETGVYAGSTPDEGSTQNAQAIQALSAVWSQATQNEWIRNYFPMLLAKRAIAGIFWSPLQDSPAIPSLEHAGLIDAQRVIKPAFHTLAALRREYVR